MMTAPVAAAAFIDDVQERQLWMLARSRTAPVRQVQRAGIVAAADGASNAAIAPALSITQDTVRTWRGRFIAAGMAGLDDLPRPGCPARYGPEVHLRILATVTSEVPEADSLRSHRLIAEHLGDVGISASQIGRILADLDLKPHRVRGTTSPSAAFAAPVGLCAADGRSSGSHDSTPAADPVTGVLRDVRRERVGVAAGERERY